MRVFTVVLLAFLASAALTSAYVVMGPGVVRERAFFTVLMTPLLWSAFMIYSYWDCSAWRPALAYVAITVACTLLIFTAEPIQG